MKISYSSVSDYKACPTKYFLKKKWKNKKFSSAFGFGSAVEEGQNVLLEGGTLEEAHAEFESNWAIKPANKWQGEFPILGNLEVEFYKSDYDQKLMEHSKEDKEFIDEIHAALESGEEVDEEDHLEYNKIMWTSCSKKAYYMLKAFQEDILDMVHEVSATQEPISLSNEDGDEATGYIDYIWDIEIDGKVVKAIVDSKTAGRPYTSHNIDASDQLRLYAASLDIEHIVYVVLSKVIKYKTICDKCGHERENSNLRNCAQCYDKKKKEGGKYTIHQPYAETQILHKELELEDIEDVMEDYSEVLTAIKNEVKFKNPGNCYAYNKPCEFYEHCWKRKALEDLPHLEKKGKK